MLILASRWRAPRSVPNKRRRRASLTFAAGLPDVLHEYVPVSEAVVLEISFVYCFAWISAWKYCIRTV